MARQWSNTTWEVVLCLNCNEKILVTRPHRPPHAVFPEERIHRAYRPYPPYLTVFCTKCGHYTVLSPETQNRVASEKSIEGYLDWVLISSWLLFLIAIATGLLYQYIAVKLVEGHFEHSENFYGILRWFIRQPDKIYAIMMVAFYLGACFFVAGALKRFGFV